MYVLAFMSLNTIYVMFGSLLNIIPVVLGMIWLNDLTNPNSAMCNLQWLTSVTLHLWPTKKFRLSWS